MKSTHKPEESGTIVSVTGEIEVDTGLRNVQTFTVSPAVANFVPDQEQNVSWYFSRPPSRRWVTIRVEKGGVNDGNIGTNPFDVSWHAIGR